MSKPTSSFRRILVWDLPTRLFHWLIVLGVLGSWLTAEVFPRFDFHWHKLIGYTLLGLILFRLIWGFVGGRYSRFLGFVRGPGAVLAYLRSMGRRDLPAHAGHNPLGALSVLALLASLLVQALTGLCVDDGVLAAGPLAPLVDGATRGLAGLIHSVNFNILLALIALHLCAIAYYAIWRRQNLVRPMVTGHAAGDPADAGSSPPLWRSLLVAAVAAGLVLLVVLGLPEWLPKAAGGGGNFNFD